MPGVLPGLASADGPAAGDSTGHADSVHGGYRLLSSCFHAGGLIDMAVGSLQPFLVTMGADMELRHSPQATLPFVAKGMYVLPG